MRFLSVRASDSIDRVLAAKTENFVALVAAAGLSSSKDFKNIRLKGVDFGGCDLTEFDFSGTTFEACSFRNVRWGRAVLTGARFSNCDPQEALDPTSNSTDRGSKRPSGRSTSTRNGPVDSAPFERGGNHGAWPKDLAHTAILAASTEGGSLNWFDCEAAALRAVRGAADDARMARVCKATAAGNTLNNKWRVVSLGAAGTGAVGTTGVIERV